MTAHFVNLLEEVQRRSLRMAAQVEDMLQEACEVIFQPMDSLARRVVSRDEEVDAEEVAIEAEVIRLMALYQPVGIDLRLLTTILKVTNDLERIADCAVNIAQRSKHLEIQPVAETCDDLRQMAPLVRRIVRDAIQAYAQEDGEVAHRALNSDAAIDRHYSQVVRQVIAQATPGAMAAYLDMLSVAKNLERIADHATNIAEDVIYLVTGSIVRHRRDGRAPIEP